MYSLYIFNIYIFYNQIRHLAQNHIVNFIKTDENKYSTTLTLDIGFCFKSYIIRTL